MKLHLPTRLRAAVLACITAIAALSTTIGTGVVAVGSVTYVMAAAQAQAADATINTNNAAISTYAAEDTLTFDLNGTTGGVNGSFLINGNQTVAAAIVVNNMILNNGYSTTTYTFTNSVSGSGQFSFSGTPTNQVYAFSGDMSNYSGNMIMNNRVTLTFDGNTSGTGIITTTSKAAKGAIPTMEDAETGAVTTNLTINVNGARMLNSAITAGTMNVSGESSFAGVVTVNAMSIAEGTVLTLNDGASLETKTALTVGAGSTLNVGNGTLMLNQALTLNGTLNLGENGKLTVGNLSAFEGITTSAPAAGENGFASAAGTIQLVNGSGSVIAEGAKKVVVSGNEFVLADNGSVEVSGIYDYGTYYLRSGQASVSALLAETDSLLKTVQVSAGAKLVVDSGALKATLIPDADYTYSLAAGLTDVNTDRTYADVSGSGQININNGATLTVAGADAAEVNIVLASAAAKLHFVNADGQGATTVTVGQINASSSPDNFEREVTVDSGVTVNASSVANGWGMKAITVDGVLNVAGELKYATGGNSAGTNVLTGIGSVTAGSLTIGNASSSNTLSVNSLTVSGNASFGRNTTISAGTMTVLGNTTQSNTLTIAGGHLVLGDAAEDTVAFNGTVALSNGTLTLNGATTLGTLNQTGGTLVNNGTLAANGAMSISTTWDNTNGTINFGSGATITLTDMSAFEGEKSYTEETQGFLQISSAKIIDGGTLTGYEGVTVTINGVASSLDETGSVAVSGDTDYTTYYLNEGNRVLSALTTASSGALATVMMGEGTSLTVDSGTVQGTVSYAGEKVFSVADGLATTLSNGLSIDGLKIDGETSANLIVANGAEVNIIGSTQGGTANFNIAANGKLNFLAGEGGTATMTIGTVKNDGDRSNNYAREMTVGTGVTLNAESVSNSWGMKGITVDGVLNVAGELKYSTGGNAQGTNVLGGSGSITAGSFSIANASTINTISVNSLTVTGDTAIGRVTELTAGTTTLQGTTNITANMNVAGGTLVLAGNATIGNNAALAVNGGTLQIDGNLNTHATLANGGSVVLNGTISTTSSALEAIGETGYTDELAPASGNGYLNGSFYVVKGGEGATSSLGADADVILDGSAVGHGSLSAADGHVTLAVASDTYYVNEGTVVYGATDNSAAAEKTAGISLNGGTLTLQQALNSGVAITASAASTLNIGEGVTLAAADLTRSAMVTLGGAGTYAATSMADLSQLTYGSDWAGTTSFDPGAGETLALNSTSIAGTLSILSGTADQFHNAGLTRNCNLHIAEGAALVDRSEWKYGFDLNGSLSGAGTLTFKAPTIDSLGDGFRAINLNGNMGDFTGLLEIESGASTHATGNDRVSVHLNSTDGVFGGVTSFIASTTNPPSADKTVAELRLMKSMTIGGLQGELGTVVGNAADTTLIIDVAEGKDLTYSGKFDMADISTVTVTGAGTQTFSGITSTGAGAIVVGTDGAPKFAGSNTISNLTIESDATLVNSGSIAITGALNLAETLVTDSTITLAEGGAIVVTDTENFTKVDPTKRVDANGVEQAVDGNGFDADGGITLVSGTAAAGVNGTATIGGISYDVVNGAVSLATYANYFVTATDASVTSAAAAAYATEKGGALTGITVSNGAAFTVDSAVDTMRTEKGGAALTVTEDATIATTEIGADTTIANSGALTAVSVSGGTSSITGEGTIGTVTVTGGSLETAGNSGALTVEGGSATIGGNSGAVVISGGSATVNGDSGAVTATGGSTTVLGSIGGNVTTNGESTILNVGGNVSGSITTSNGVVKFTASETNHTVHLIDLSKGDTALGHVEIESGATVEQTDNNLWMRAANAGVLLAEGGTMITNQGHVTVTGLADGGSITITEGQNYYQTGVDKFVFTNVAVSTANEGATSLATHLSGATVENLGTGMLTVISDGEGSITSVAATNGNVTVNGRADETVIALDSVTLAAGKSLTLNRDVTIGKLNVDLATYVTEVPTEALTLVSTAEGKTITCDSLVTTPQAVTINDQTYVAQLTLAGNSLTLAYSEVTDLYWNGGSGNLSDAAWAAASGESAGKLPFVAEAPVVFDGEGGTIVVDSAATVGNMTVQGDYSFTSSSSLTINGTLTVDGATATFDAVPGANSIVVNAESTLDLSAADMTSSTDADHGKLNALLTKVSGEGTTIISGHHDAGKAVLLGVETTVSTDLQVKDGMRVNSWTNRNCSLIVAEGGTLTVQDKALRLESTAKLSVTGGDVVAEAGLALGHGSEAGNPGHLSMSAGSVTTTSIILRDDTTRNTIDITGGTLTITGANAFTGTGNATTVSINGAMLATDGEHSWTLNHTATLTDVTVAAAEGTSITLGGTGTTTINGSLTNTGAMALGGDLSMGALDNSGTIDLGSNALTLTAATTAGGTMTGAGSLTLTGANSFTALTLGTLDISAAGTTATVEGTLAANTVTLGAFSNALTAAGVGEGVAFNADAVELNKGTHTIATLTGESGFGSTTLVIGEQTITIGDSPVELTGTGQLVSLVTSEDGKTLSVVVAYNGSEWTEEIDPGTGEAQWTQDMVTADSVNFSGNGSDTVTIAEDITVGTIVVDSDTEAKEYTFAGDNSVTTDKLDMSTGSSTLTVETDMVVNNDATIGGSTADDTATLTVAEGGSLTAGSVTVNSEGGLTVDGEAAIDTLTVAADNALTIGTTGDVTIGTLSADGEQTIDIANDGALTITNGTIDSLTGEGTLTVADGGTVTLKSDLTTGDLTANGALTIEGDLAADALSGTGSVSTTGDITADSISGVSVAADTLSTTQVGNTVKDLTINMLEVTTVEGIGADEVTETDRDSYVEVSGTVGTLDTSLTTITIVLTDDAKTAVLGEMETADARDYLIIDGTTAVNKFVFDATQKQDFLKEGYKTSLVQGSVHLSVEGLSAAEKSWTVGSAKTEGGLEITTTGADAYAELASDGVENVHVANNGTINLTGAPAEVTLKNLSSAAGTTLTVTGEAGDTATLLATDAAGDYASKAHAGSLKADTVNVSVDGGETKLGAVELTNGAALTTTQGSSLSVGKLNAATPAAGSIAGDITVTGQGGSYKGAYAAPTTVTLAAGAKQTLSSDANLSLKGAGEATLGGNNGVATLKGLDMNGGTLNLGTNTLTVLDADSAFKNGTISATISTDDVPLTLVNATNLDLSGSTLKLALTGSPDALLAQGAEVTLADLGATTNTTGMSVALTGLTMGKYFTDAVVNGGLVQATRNTSFYSDLLDATDNAATGAALLDDALVALDPQHSNPTGALAAVMDALDSTVDSASAERIATAVSGSSIAAMGSALSGDVERQLRAIRNRTTTMGVNQAVINEGMPYVNAWVNAEGDYRKVAADGTLAGYKMTSWGGTVGADIDVTPSFTCGLAATAMYGDFDADSADHATGDIDTYYVSAFARYAKHRWTHTFVATAGMADTSLERTVMGHTVKGDSDGMMFGGMYEVGYVFALDKEATTCLQPVLNVSYTHTSLSGYTEKGADIALTAGDTELNKLTVGVGARLQSVIGENIYNRSSIFEGRAMLKFDAGDRQAETDVAVAGLGMGSHTTKSTETGAIGAEFGVGLTVPVGSEGGNIFMDASAEIRAEYTNVNATVGYRVNF